MPKVTQQVSGRVGTTGPPAVAVPRAPGRGPQKGLLPAPPAARPPARHKVGSLGWGLARERAAGRPRGPGGRSHQPADSGTQSGRTWRRGAGGRARGGGGRSGAGLVSRPGRRGRPGLRGPGARTAGCRRAPPAPSLPGPGGPAALALTYLQAAGGRGEGAAPPSLPPPPGCPPGSPPGPRSVLRLQPTAAGTARAQGEAGPAGRSEESAGPPGAAQNPLSYPRPAPPRGGPRPLAGVAGGSGRSRDPLPPLRPFPAAAARARTCEVGHRSGEEKPGTWSREGGRAEGAGRERSRSWRMMLQLDGWKLDSRRDFPLGKGRGGGPQTWTVRGRMTGAEKRRREALFWRQDEVQRTIATSLSEALIGFCLWWCSHSLNRGGADFAAGGMEVRLQIHGLSKASQGLS